MAEAGVPEGFDHCANVPVPSAAWTAGALKPASIKARALAITRVRRIRRTIYTTLSPRETGFTPVKRKSQHAAAPPHQRSVIRMLP